MPETTKTDSLTNEAIKQKKTNNSSTTLSTTLSYLKQLIADERLNFSKFFSGNEGAQKQAKVSDANAEDGEIYDEEPYFMMSQLVMHTAQLAERLHPGTQLSKEESEQEADLVYRLITSAVSARLAGADAIFQALKKRYERS